MSGQLGQHAFALPAARVTGRLSLVNNHFLTQLQPQIADGRQRGLAITRHHQIQKDRHRFRILGTRSAGEHQRIGQRPVLGVQRDPTQVQDGQQVRVTDFVLQGDAQHVEVGQGGERFQAVKRQVRFAQGGLHVRPGRKYPLADPIRASVH